MARLVPMTKEKAVIEVIKYNKPKTAQDLVNDCELPVKFVGGGAFRDSYHILGSSLLVKMPRVKETKGSTKYEDNLIHAGQEHFAWKMINKSRTKKLAPLKPHLPEFLHYDHDTGIAVVRKYRNVRDTKDVRKWCDGISCIIEDYFGVNCTDLNFNNLGRDKDGNLRFIDMGMFCDF